MKSVILLRMKTILFAVLLSFFYLWNGVLFAGTQLPVEALPSVWLTGEAPKAWEEGKVYILECWATWCGPCLKAMPHMEELWLALKDEGVCVIGINVSDRLNDEQLRDFLAKQTVRPTYPMAVDRKAQMKQLLHFQGIPFACIIKQGEVVWTGHPASLTAERIRALRDGREYDPKNEPRKAGPMMYVYQLENRADCARRQHQRIALQREALRKLPDQQRLAEPFFPRLIEAKAPELSFENVEHVTDAGDAAPYAALIGRPIPLDDQLTVVELWKHPWRVAKITQTTQRELPGKKIAAALQCPYRRWTLIREGEANDAMKWAQRVGVQFTNYTITNGEVDALFNVTDRLNYPFVAVFRKGVLLYVGSVELLPVQLVTDFERTPEEVRDAVKAAEQREKEDLKRAIALTTGRLNPPDLAAYLEEAPLSDRCNAAILQNLFIPYREKDDVMGAVACFKRLTQRHLNDEQSLITLRKVPETWPDLASLVHAEQSVIAERLAELNRSGDPSVISIWYLLAAESALKADQKERHDALVKRAISCSPSGMRWQQILRNQNAWPCR